MPAKKTKKKEPPPEQLNACHVAGCSEPGAYKAPASRDAIHEYRWYCLDHVREYNKQWDFFAGLKPDEIEAFMKDAVTGHRPTWSRFNGSPQEKLQQAIHQFVHGEHPHGSTAAHVPPRLRQALALLDLEYPYTEKTLKIQYRVMVKKHHPDMNKGDKQSEETFKKITAAYRSLIAHID